MKFKIALVQHPMYFLIKEDTLCAERTPPWGSPTIEGYIDRIRQNLAVLKKYPQLKIGFEWSALELELLNQDAPDVFQEMMALVGAGKSTLYNGTYAQPHLQTLSSEANYRQFEVGMKVYADLCQQKITTYAHQETSINEQTPQLLKAFGIKYMPLPSFVSTIVVEGAEFVYHVRHGMRIVHGSEFTKWRGLDGTLIDVYLREPPYLPIKEWMDLPEGTGLLHAPSIVIDVPDLIAVDNEWLEERAKAEFSLLDEDLPELLAQNPARFQSRVYANWSYIEGIRAEELSRNNFLSERAALRAEAMNTLAYALMERPAESTDAIWKTILATQHHDVYCFCAPELREKSVNWLKEEQSKANHLVQNAADALLHHVAALPSSGKQIVVFNTTPQPVLSPVSLEVPYTSPEVVDQTGKAIASQVLSTGQNSSNVTFLTDSQGLGYTSYIVKEGDKSKTVRKAMEEKYIFENEFYSCVVLPDGTVPSLKLSSTGEELLNSTKMGGNQLAGQDSTGLGLTHEGTWDVGHRGPNKGEKWRPAERGPEIKWASIDQASVLESPIGVLVTLKGNLSANIPAELKISFYHQLPRIDFEWSFDFDQSSIGSFFDDETKLRVQWPLNYEGDIVHDIAFGAVHSYKERPFLPASWVDISDSKKGFAYFHQGTIKHWVQDQTLENLFAWGEITDAIGARTGVGRWPKSFDQRINGHQTICYAIYPHLGDWHNGDVVGVSRSYITPPIGFIKQNPTGDLPAQYTLLQIANPHLVSTAVKIEEDQVLCRLYSIGSNSEPISINAEKLSLQSATAVDGESLTNLKPYQIGKLLLHKGK